MKKSILFIILLISFVSFSQEDHDISYGFESNSQYYLDDSKTGDFWNRTDFDRITFLKSTILIKTFMRVCK